MKTQALRSLLTSKNLSFLMEAHSALSARIVQEAGFPAVWASGFCIAAQLGLRDNNEASWSQVCDIAEFMSDATDIPILMDGDTGFGNFNNARLLVKKLEKIGVAGVCVEDKLFPKSNSMLDAEKPQPLADINEFALKIRAMKDTQRDPNFSVVARVESFAAGWPLEDALKRADAYADAGGDAILILSKKADLSEINAFMKHWNNKKPIVVVPTSMPSVTGAEFSEAGLSAVIWANQNLRSTITAMQQTSTEMFESMSVLSSEKRITPVKEVFRLQNLDEYTAAEEKYLPKTPVS